MRVTSGLRIGLAVVGLAAALAGPLAAGAAAGAADERRGGDDPAALAVGVGYYDVVRQRSGAEMIDIEYRSDARLWWFKPQMGMWATSDGSFYTYAGVRMDVYLGNRLVFSPSFAPGFYLKGDGRDLGYVIEFRSSAEIAYRFDDYSRISLGIAHLSNASLGGAGPGLLLPTDPPRNPGVETLTLNYSIPIDAGPEPKGGDRLGPCCTGFYATAVLTGGGGFLGGIHSAGPTQGTVKDKTAQDSVANGGLAFGYDWRRHGVPVRTEIEYGHMVRLDWDSRPAFKDALPNAGFSDNLNTTTVLFNALYDFDVGYSWWRPYAGFSVGYARNHSDNSWNDFSVADPHDTKREEQFDTHNFAWGLTAGARVDITDTWFTEAAYRFLDVGRALTGFTPAGVRIEADHFYRHDLRLGFGYRF